MTEWDRRELCPDGACVGVIGADGLCKVCGRAAQNWGDERRRGLVVPEDEQQDEDDEADDDVDEKHEDQDDAVKDDDSTSGSTSDSTSEPASGSASDLDSDRAYEWSRRRLCDNGSCVGVIGENGKCRVCGKTP